MYNIYYVCVTNIKYKFNQNLINISQLPISLYIFEIYIILDRSKLEMPEINFS